ncbi:uncharacterized protein LOC144864646 [Branchiostoma floridae x Branchiostoma japonicum]
MPRRKKPKLTRWLAWKAKKAEEEKKKIRDEQDRAALEPAEEQQVEGAQGETRRRKSTRVLTLNAWKEKAELEKKKMEDELCKAQQAKKAQEKMRRRKNQMLAKLKARKAEREKKKRRQQQRKERQKLAKVRAQEKLAELEQTADETHIKEEETGDTGWQQDGQENVLCQETYSGDQETYDYFCSNQPTRQARNETYNSLEQTTDTGRQQKEERAVPNEETCGVKAEMEESSCEVSTANFCAGNPGHHGNEMDDTTHPGKESDNRETQTTDMGLQQETCDVNFPQPAEIHNEDRETYNFICSVLPSEHPWHKIYNSSKATTDTGRQQDEEREVLNDETRGVRAEMKESSCELFTGERGVGHPGKEMDSTEHPGKESIETQTTDMGLQQEMCDVNFPQPDNTSTLQVLVQESRGITGMHVVEHTVEKPYMCGKCGFRTAKKCYLSRHMRNHTGEKPYMCNQCDFSTAEKSKLVRHVTKHTGEKPYMCGECGYRTNYQVSLSRHMRTHTGEKPYKCHQCNYSAAQKYSLERHRINHLGEKTYICGECGFNTTRKSSFLQHEKTHRRKPLQA